ncbi:MAG: hypothetical protein N2V77_01765 [Canidatus Methanoxibalbensis ujae]|nr:hypothetical protein [Candidatus Methanoxibalbensis ujae]MCW7078452.1 hypothetical protein [Candidatus Methanoxibalbensis ujae]
MEGKMEIDHKKDAVILWFLSAKKICRFFIIALSTSSHGFLRLPGEEVWSELERELER